MTLPEIHLSFIQALTHHQTEYLVVGGMAVVAHGVDRNTGDMDIWVDASIQNMAALEAALLSLQFEKTEVEAAVEAFRKHGKIAIVLDQKFPIEMLSSFSSYITFQEAFAKKKVVDFSGVPLNIIDIDTLIELKIRAGREKDFWDASKLKAQKKKL